MGIMTGLVTRSWEERFWFPAGQAETVVSVRPWFAELPKGALGIMIGLKNGVLACVSLPVGQADTVLSVAP